MGPRSRTPQRGLRDIRTYSGRVDRIGIPYMAYMRISCMEMEKARRDRERQSALARIKNIDERLADLEAEKDAVLKRLGERTEAGKQSASTLQRSAPHASRQGKRGFKISY